MKPDQVRVTVTIHVVAVSGDLETKHARRTCSVQRMVDWPRTIERTALWAETQARLATVAALREAGASE